MEALHLQMVRLLDRADVEYPHLSADGRIMKVVDHVLKVASGDKSVEYWAAQTIFATSAWRRYGKRRYVLGETFAAAMMLTRSAPIESFESFPLPAFSIEIPAQYLGLSSTPDPIAIALCTFTPDTNGHVILGLAGEHIFHVHVDWGNGEPEKPQGPLHTTWVRIVSNTIQYVTQYRESPACVASRPAKKGASNNCFDLRLPVEITRSSSFDAKTLRQQALALVASKSARDLRNVLQHIVRGHWKQQPCGDRRSDRKKIWVQPYTRGDLSLGRIVSKTEHIYVRTDCQSPPVDSGCNKETEKNQA